MNQSCGGYSQPGMMTTTPEFPGLPDPNAQFQLLDSLIPGFSIFSNTLNKYTGIDLQYYIPAILVFGLAIFAYRYISVLAEEFINKHLMSTANVRTDDEMYNMLMAWVASQNFAKNSRQFVANTNINSRMWWLFRDEERDDDEDDQTLKTQLRGGKEKKVLFTPSFGAHYFFYKGWPMIFRRTEDPRQSFGSISDREHISVSSFGRNPVLLRELLDDCRQAFSKNDEKKTIIYRGSLKPRTAEPMWTRSVSRVSRPFSTVVLDLDIKERLLKDITDYLDPLTRRWYSNRGIPYRRGYLFWGPPGCGKSSLAYVIAGFFKLKIYTVSLNSLAMNEENLGTLFAELPQRCVVLLEDIDTAGLTHTRDNPNPAPEAILPIIPSTTITAPTTSSNGGRISLSALLNVIDGVAATEGRILIMTTNHLDKLDDALIRPGRVDLTVKFDLASTKMISTIFRGIFITLEGDRPPLPRTAAPAVTIRKSSREIEKASLLALAKEKRLSDELEAKRVTEEDKIFKLSEEFAAVLPTMTFSPAELQGYLLRWKRDPEGAVSGATEWVSTAITEKKKKERKEAEKEEKEKAALAKAEKEKILKAKAEREKGEKNKTEGSDSGVEI